jgi:hypothetical protein
MKPLGGLAGIGFTGTAAGEGKKDDVSGHGDVALDLHSGNMKSPSKMVEIASDATTGTDVSTEAVVPGVGGGLSLEGSLTTDGQGASDINNLDPVGGWNGDYDITYDLTGEVLAEVENTAMLYKSQERDNDNRFHYMMWLWSQADAQGLWPYDWFSNRVNVTTDSVYLANWAPTRTIDKNNQPVSIGLQVGLDGGPTIGISGSTEIKDGEFYTDEITVGSAGLHKIRFEGGSVDSTNSINGVTHFGSENDYALYQDSLPRGHFDMYAEGWSG